MKTKVSLLLIILILGTLNAFSSNAREETKRIITQSYTVSNNSELSIDNRYGSIRIIEWDKNEINFNIEIIGKANNIKTAEALVDRVSIDFNQSGKKVTAVTVFSNIKQSNCNNCSSSVNYTVNVPSAIYMQLSNKYGNIILNNDAQLNFKADVKYGSITLNNLNGEKNNIYVGYGKISLENAKHLDLELSYSKGTAVNIDQLILKSAYGGFNANNINTWKLSSKYDKFAVDELGSADISGGYSGFKIGTLKNNLKIESLKYGNLTINRVDTDFESINITAAYSDVKISIGANLSFKADLSVSYGNINTQKLTFSDTNYNKSNSTTSFSGIAGSEKEPKASIYIRNRYANINLGN